MPMRSTKILQAQWDTLAQLANTKLLPIVNAAVAAGHWPQMAFTYSGGKLTNVAGTGNVFDIPAATTDGVHVLKNPQPDYNFSGSNFLSELNRIRGDILILFNSTYDASISDLGYPIYEPLFLSPDGILSGPWCIAVNDPDTFEMGLNQGIFDASIGYLFYGLFQPAVYYCIFQSVEFWSASDTVELNQKMTLAQFSDLFNGVSVNPQPSNTITFRFFFNLDSGSDYGNIDFVISTSPLAHEATSITASATGGTITSQNVIGGGVDPQYLQFTLRIDTVAGLNEVVVDIEYDFSFSNTESVPTLTVEALELNFNSSSREVVEVVSVTTDTFYKLKQPFHDQKNSLIIRGTKIWSFAFQFLLSDSSVKGALVARTLPVPALNVFLDKDCPTYIEKLIELPNVDIDYGKVGVASDYGLIPGDLVLNPPTDRPDNSAPVAQSSQRENAFLAVEDKYNLINESLQMQPSPWLVRRDTDFVPFQIGNWQTNTLSIFANQTARAGSVPTYYGIFIPNDSTAVKIKLVKKGTGTKGWKAGSGNKEFTYGDPIGKNLKIYVSRDNFPDPNNPLTYDFVTTNNEVSIPPDHGGVINSIADILGIGFNFAVVNSDNPTENVEFDLVQEIDHAPDVRLYFPPPKTWECFSHSLHGEPYLAQWINLRHQPDANNSLSFSNPIPQNGHCIFKIRATRLPKDNVAGKAVTPTSGNLIIATIGQNKLQNDGTLLFVPFTVGGNPYTITIAADARDSGDVDVFWLVLDGNEIVWQCAEEIIFEAWSNWQPTFNFTGFAKFPEGYRHSDSDIYAVEIIPTFYQYALGFTNYFLLSYCNYPANGTGAQSGEYVTTRTQFPVSVEIYNDLLAVIGLIQ